MNWEIGIDIYTLICIKWITNKNLLYKKIKFKKIFDIYSSRKKCNPFCCFRQLFCLWNLSFFAAGYIGAEINALLFPQDLLCINCSVRVMSKFFHFSK